MSTGEGGVTRRRFLANSVAASGLGSVRGQPSSGGKRPNVLIILSDQLRWDAVGAYGLNPMHLTPNLDRMARKGVLFESAFTNQPVCAASRACLFTGQYATKCGIWHNGLGLAPHQPTFAKQFRSAGYTANYIGKWHLMAADNDVNSSNHTGWGAVPSQYRGGFDDLWEASNLLEFTTHPFEGEIYDRDGNPIRYKDQYRVDFLTGRAVRFLRDAPREPFLLVISIYEPHEQDDLHEIIAPKGYEERYRNPFIPGDLLPFPGDWQRQMPGYCGCIKSVDEAVGTLLKTLADTNLAENTIVIFTSDHGCHFKTRNRGDKRSCHDSSIRVPLIMQGPGLNRSREIRDIVSHVDFAPTLLQLVGISPSPGMQGRSAVPLLDGSSIDWRNEAFIQISETMVGRAIRDEQFTYCILDPDGDGFRDRESRRYTEHQLYDNFRDPHQIVNMAGRAEYERAATRLRTHLLVRLAEAGEPEPAIADARFYP